MKTLKHKLLIAAVLLGQLFYFSEILMPFSWGKLKVQGLACTCPDMSVLTGSLYLRSITPENISKFDIDYSEIYLTDDSYEKFPKDLSAVDIFSKSIIKGKVVGKRQIEGGKTRNVIFKVEEWHTLDGLEYLIVKIAFYFQIFIFGIFFWLKRIKHH